MSLADRFCDTVDRINSWVGRFFALSIFVVVIAVLYEVFARTTFGQATIWSNETTIYLSAAVTGTDAARSPNTSAASIRAAPRPRGVWSMSEPW